MRYAPAVLDLILVGMAMEGAVLVGCWQATGRGVSPGALLPNLAAGMALLLAMRLALGGAWWGYVSAALLVALAGHVADLRGRWHQVDRGRAGRVVSQPAALPGDPSI